MPKLIENFLPNPPNYDELDKIIDEAGLWESMCVKDRQTPVRTGKKGCFIGIPDEHGGLPILRCPSFFECKPVPEKLMEFLKLFSNSVDFNIIKIQKYTKGVEGIARHSDKCIDMYDGVPVCIYRLNKENDKVRSLNFCHKENKNDAHYFKMKSNSLIEIDYKENLRTVHWVPLEDDQNTTSECISLVLRRSKTFQLPSGHIYGGAAKYKSYEERMASKEEPVNIRSRYNNVINMYHIENTTDISEKRPKEFIDVCNAIIQDTL